MGNTLGVPNKAVGSAVTVACKIPMGLLLKLFEPKEFYEPVMGGGTRKITQYVEKYNSPTFKLNGCSYPQNAAPAQQILNGYGLTHGIPKDFWEEWLAQNKDADFVKNGMIFAHVEMASVNSETNEKVKEKSGLERLDPKEIHKHGVNLQQATV